MLAAVSAYFIDRWSYARWADTLIEDAHRMKTRQRVQLRVSPDYIEVKPSGDVVLYYIPPRSAWLTRLRFPDHISTAYIVTLSDRPGMPAVRIDHDLW